MRLIDANTLKEWVENWFTKNQFYHPYAKNNNIPITELYDMLEQMPSAQTERKKGKWIDQDGGAFYTMECSECHKEPLLDEYGDYVQSDFCPHCGADMRGEQDDKGRR